MDHRAPSPVGRVLLELDATDLAYLADSGMALLYRSYEDEKGAISPHVAGPLDVLNRRLHRAADAVWDAPHLEAANDDH